MCFRDMGKCKSVRVLLLTDMEDADHGLIVTPWCRQPAQRGAQVRPVTSVLGYSPCILPLRCRRTDEMNWRKSLGTWRAPYASCMCSAPSWYNGRSEEVDESARSGRNDRVTLAVVLYEGTCPQNRHIIQPGLMKHIVVARE